MPDIQNTASLIAVLTSHLEAKLDADLSKASIEICEIDPRDYAVADDSESARKTVSGVIDELRAADLFASHYVGMMNFGIDDPIILERLPDGTISLVDGEMRCTIALARDEKIQAIIIGGHIWGRNDKEDLPVASGDIAF